MVFDRRMIASRRGSRAPFRDASSASRGSPARRRSSDSRTRPPRGGIRPPPPPRPRERSGRSGPFVTAFLGSGRPPDRRRHDLVDRARGRPERTTTRPRGGAVEFRQVDRSTRLPRRRGGAMPSRPARERLPGERRTQRLSARRARRTSRPLGCPGRLHRRLVRGDDGRRIQLPHRPIPELLPGLGGVGHRTEERERVPIGAAADRGVDHGEALDHQARRGGCPGDSRPVRGDSAPLTTPQVGRNAPLRHEASTHSFGSQPLRRRSPSRKFLRIVQVAGALSPSGLVAKAVVAQVTGSPDGCTPWV